MTTSNSTDLEKAANLLRQSSSFLIASHVNPDGDAIGSMCAISLALKSLGKQVVLLNQDGVPEIYKFLPEAENVLTNAPDYVRCQVALILDCEDLGRLGTIETVLQNCDTIVEIDHHPVQTRNSNLVIVDPDIASTGEIVLSLLRTAQIPITPPIAECLLTAILADTGSFKFSNTQPATLRSAADLLEVGASISQIAHKIFEVRSLSSVKLLGFALSTISTAAGGRIAYATVTREHFAISHANEAETEGIVNVIRSIRGVHVGILFRETESGTRVSLRSRENTDISQVARLFHGGGHKNAAGCTVPYPLDEAVNLVISAVEKWMAS